MEWRWDAVAAAENGVSFPHDGRCWWNDSIVRVWMTVRRRHGWGSGDGRLI